jgi:hypothetical protein
VPEHYDFFETPIIPYTTLQDRTEVVIHVRDGETMQQSAVRGIVARAAASLPEGAAIPLHCYGRLGVRITDPWFIHVLEELDEEALSTDHEVAQSQDIEQSLKSPEQFKRSRYRKDEGGK